MKVTGIIRRLDELGRVVIPREYRRLYSINVGDPLELKASETGEIIIKKVDNSGDFITLAKEAFSLINGNVKCAVCTLKNIVFSQDEQIMDLHAYIAHTLGGRRGYAGESITVMPDCPFRYVAFSPVIGETDVFGGLIVFSNERIDDKIIFLIEAAGRIIGKSLQKY